MSAGKTSGKSAQAGAIVVTGGGRGIGAEIAVKAAARGLPVAFLYRSRSTDAEQTLRRIEDAGGSALAIKADVGVEEDIVTAFNKIDEAFGTIAGLVNNAATNGGRSTIHELAAERLQSTFATNVFGPFLCIREAARRMSTSRGGKGGAIVNISSGATKIGAPGVWVHYAASKGALEVMSLGLARELADEGIRVNVARAGVIDTEVHQGHGEDRLQQLLQRVPMKRMGQPEEVANAVLWLLSSEASYVTGTIVDVAGGL